MERIDIPRLWRGTWETETARSRATGKVYSTEYSTQVVEGTPEYLLALLARARVGAHTVERIGNWLRALLEAMLGALTSRCTSFPERSERPLADRNTGFVTGRGTGSRARRGQGLGHWSGRGTRRALAWHAWTLVRAPYCIVSGLRTVYHKPRQACPTCFLLSCKEDHLAWTNYYWEVP